METFEEKVERVARVFYKTLASRRTDDAWDHESEFHKDRYRSATIAALIEEAGGISHVRSEDYLKWEPVA